MSISFGGFKNYSYLCVIGWFKFQRVLKKDVKNFGSLKKITNFKASKVVKRGKRQKQKSSLTCWERSEGKKGQPYTLRG
jgi:hypothetical protein